MALAMSMPAVLCVVLVVLGACANANLNKDIADASNKEDCLTCTMMMVIEDKFSELDLEATPDPNEHSRLDCKEYALCVNDLGSDIRFNMPVREIWEKFGVGGGDTICVDQAWLLANEGREHRVRRDEDETYTVSVMPNFTKIIDDRNRSKRQYAEAVAGLGARTVLIMRVTYVYQNTVYTPSYCDSDCIRDNMWNANKNVNGLVREMSEGRTWFPQSRSKVIDVVVNGQYGGGNCMFWEIGLEADSAALNAGEDPSSYDHRSYYLPANLGGCTWGGLGYVGCTGGYCKTWIRQAAGGTLAHELGHNLGVWHSALDYTNDGVQESEYGDNSDVMGSTTNWRGMNAAHRYVLNWVDPINQVINYEQWQMHCHTPVNLRLWSLSTPSQTNKIEMLTVYRGSPGGGKYYISLRTNRGYDQDLNAVWQNQVYIHYLTMHSTRFQTNSQLVARLYGGNQYWMDVSSPFYIEVQNIAPNGAWADITYHFCAPGQNPSLTDEPTVPPTLQPTPDPATQADMCVDDEKEKCPLWAGEDFCKEGGLYYPYMYEHCQLSCGFCKAVTGPPTLVEEPIKQNKDGGAVVESESRFMCALLEPNRLRPKCGPSADGMQCCSHQGTRCTELRVGKPNAVWRCIVTGRAGSLPDGAYCTNNRLCANTCDRIKWECSSNSSSRRSRRAAADDYDEILDADEMFVEDEQAPWSDSKATRQAAFAVVIASCAITLLALIVRRSTSEHKAIEIDGSEVSEPRTEFVHLPATRARSQLIQEPSSASMTA